MKTVRTRTRGHSKRQAQKAQALAPWKQAKRGELLHSRRRMKPAISSGKSAEQAAPEGPQANRLEAPLATRIPESAHSRWIRRCDDGGLAPKLTPEGLGLLKSWILLHPEISDTAVLELERIANDLGQVIELVLGRLHPSKRLRALWYSRRRRAGTEWLALEEEGEFLLTQVELELPEWVAFWQTRREEVVFH